MRDWLVPARPVSAYLFLLVVGSAMVRARPDGRAPAPKGFAMKFPTNTKPLAWGAVGGAVACMIVGFSWGGWVTGSTARQDAATAARDAVVVALAPICAERFRAQGDAPARIAELAKASSWEQGNVIEKSGYALMPGSKTTDSDVARACAEMLATPPTPKT